MKMDKVVYESLPDRIRNDLDTDNFSVCNPNDPDRKIEDVVRAAGKYAVLLVPLEDVDISSLPDVIDNQYQLTFFRIIDSKDGGNTLWDGKNILLVYQTKSEDSHLRMDEIFNDQIKGLLAARYMQRKALQEIRTAREEYNGVIKRAIDADGLLKSRLDAVSGSVSFKAAHASVEAKHILLGSKEEKRRGIQWLKDRSTDTKFNYLREICELETLISEDIAKVGDYMETLVTFDREKSIITDFVEKGMSADFVFVHPSLIDWDVPLFQRPQQMAMALCQIGVPVIYFTWNNYDDIDEPVCIFDHCLLIKAVNMDEVKQKIRQIGQLLDSLGMKMVVDLYSTGYMYDMSFFEPYDFRKHTVLYEYVDELAPAVAGMDIPEQHLEMHRSLLEDENIKVIATAAKLYDDVLELRGSSKNVLYSGNGVDTEHFQNPAEPGGLSEKLAGVINGTKPVIGYFGALASWFDFELVREAARRRPDYNFVLIGPDYGDATREIAGLSEFDNIIVTGAIDYNVLPGVANHFTVATIPFLINDITESTSPIKLFEYMSMGKPVVTTAMRECLNIPEVMTVNNAEEYVIALDKAVAIMNGTGRFEYEQKMVALAERYSWKAKARELVDLVKS